MSYFREEKIFDSKSPLFVSGRGKEINHHEVSVKFRDMEEKKALGLEERAVVDSWERDACNIKSYLGKQRDETQSNGIY
jgi:hypothetical protein